jgi:hypothetical protein
MLFRSCLVLALPLVLVVLGSLVLGGRQGPADLALLFEEIARSWDYDARVERARVVCPERLSTKGRIAAEVIQGRLTLREAAAQFRELDERLPLLGVPGPLVDGRTPDEKACRDVLFWVEAALDREPDRAVPGLLERLVRERGCLTANRE